MSLLIESVSNFEQVDNQAAIQDLVVNQSAMVKTNLAVSGSSTLSGAFVEGITTATTSNLILTSAPNFGGILFLTSSRITFGVISAGTIGQKLNVYAPFITGNALTSVWNLTVTGVVGNGDQSPNQINIPRFNRAISGGLSAHMTCITGDGQFRWMVC
jgi:hypothetical protein